jgi:hypothetical protein
MKTVVSVAVATVLGVLIAGCGSTHEITITAATTGLPNPAATATQLGESTSTEANTTTTTAQLPQVNPANLKSVATVKINNSDGYTATITLSRGSIRKAKPLMNGSVSLGSACQVDMQTDGIEPFILTLTNTTTGYSDSPSAEIDAQAPAPIGALPVSAEVGYSSGAQCINFVSGASSEDNNDSSANQFMTVSANSPLAPGASTTVSGFLIAHNYYSPANPDGNPSSLQNIILTIEPQYGGDNWNDAGGSGVMSSDVVANAIPFLPSGNGGCLIHQPCG